MLARWQYTPDEWRDFTGYERKSNHFELGDVLTKNFHAVVAGGVLVGVVGAVGGGVAGAFVSLALVGGFLLLATALHRAARTSAQRGLEASAGEVLIAGDGVCTNGMWFGWAARDPAWRLRAVRRVTISISLGKPMALLEFKCVGAVPRRIGRPAVEKEWRVPVPAGKEAEADVVITRLLDTKRPPPGRAGDLHARPRP